MNRKLISSLPLASLAAAVLATALAGCAPLVLGGAAVGTALMATDRRTSGAQIDDEAIELRAATRLSQAMGDRVHINVTSYNRQVLLTGETPTEALKQEAERIVAGVDNVRGIVNELGVMTPTTLPQRSGDVLSTCTPPRRRYAPNGAGETRRSRRYAAGPSSRPGAESRLVRQIS